MNMSGIKKLFAALLAFVLIFACFGAVLAESAQQSESVEALETALDYALAENWALFADGGDEKSADVFLICPTVDTRSYANSIDLNEKLKKRFVDELNKEKGIFSGVARIYSPFYRQMSINGYLLEDGQREQAFENAWLDVKSAFRWYLDNENNGRPIVLAGFSQGAQMCIELLKEFYGGEGAEARLLRESLVSVYALGYSIGADELSKYPQIKLASGESDFGSVVMFDCEDGTVKDSIFIPEGTKGMAINPLNWKTDSTPAAKELNKGALVGEGFSEGLCGCYIDTERGALVVTDVSREDFPNPLPQLFEDGSYHVYTYMFFYKNLENSLEKRLDAFLTAREGPANKVFGSEYLLSLQSVRDNAPWLGKLAERFCELNALLLPALCVFLYIAVDKRFGRIALLNFGASELANLTVKNTACVKRPYLRDSRIVPVKASSSYSMPSGHTMYAASIYGSIGAWQRKRHSWITVLCIVLILLTGFARNFVGAHTPQDVAVSIVLTLIVMLAMTRLAIFLEKNPNKTEAFLLLGALAGIAVLVYANFKSYPENGLAQVNIEKAKAEVFASFGKWIGLLLAIFIDLRFIRYEVDKKSGTRFIFGIIGAILFIGAALLTSKAGGIFAAKAGGAACWCIVYVAALAVLPMILKRISKKKAEAVRR